MINLISISPRFIHPLSKVNIQDGTRRDAIALEPYLVSHIVTIACFIFYTLDNTVARGSHSSSENIETFFASGSRCSGSRRATIMRSFTVSYK